MMKRKVTKLIIAVVILLVLVGAGVGVYFYRQQGPIVGRVQYDEYYYLTSIRPTERFKGATMSRDSYLHIRSDGTGELYLKGLEATTAPIHLIITSYKEGIKQTVIEFEYLLDNGEDTQIQHLTATSTKDEIRIKAVESHDVNVIQQKRDQIESLDYSVTILVFALPQEVAA